MILPIDSGNKTAASTAAASNIAATGTATRRNRFGEASARRGIVLYGMPYFSASARRRSIFSRHSRIISASATKSFGR
jgi:hypothetical protein